MCHIFTSSLLLFCDICVIMYCKMPQTAELRKEDKRILFDKKENTERVQKPSDYGKLSDAQLMELCAAKDEEAFSELVGRYEKFVYSAVFAELKDADDAFDVSQEVFIRLYNAAGGFRCESTLKTWLYRMCKNCAYDYMRKFYKNRPLSLSVPCDEDDTSQETDVVSKDDTPEESVLKKERINAVRRAISELPEEQRDVIVLRELEGLQYSEIADILGINEGTVKSRISRGREALKKFLENYRL